MCISCLDNMNFINGWVLSHVGLVRTPWLTRVMIFVTSFGNPSSMVLLCLALILALWLHRKPRHVIQFVLTLGVGLALSFLIKLVVHLPRPAGGLITESGYSFASGHASTATVFFFLIAYSYKSHIRSRSLRITFVIANVLAAFLIGFSRIYLGVHYATDVIFGFIIGLLVSSVSVMILQSYERNHPVIESNR